MAEMTERPPTFMRHDDGRVTVDYWPDRAWCSATLLEVADPAHIHREGDLITITVSNGEAVYQLGELGPNGCYEVVAVRRAWTCSERGLPRGAAP